MKFKEIELIQWQQFEKIGIDFSKRLTVITGANGSGKTTILSILAKHCSWERPSLGVPKKDKESGIIKFFARLFKGVEKKIQQSVILNILIIILQKLIFL